MDFDLLVGKSIAPLLNRLNIKTGKGNTWTRDRVRSFRNDHGIAVYDGQEQSDMLTLEVIAKHLGISAQSVRSLINGKTIVATQVIPYAPWMISSTELEKKEVLDEVERIKQRKNKKYPSRCEKQLEIF